MTKSARMMLVGLMAVGMATGTAACGSLRTASQRGAGVRLIAAGREPDDRPTLEHYLNSPRNATQADLRTDLLIPIRPTTPL